MVVISFLTVGSISNDILISVIFLFRDLAHMSIKVLMLFMLTCKIASFYKHQPSLRKIFANANLSYVMILWITLLV